MKSPLRIGLTWFAVIAVVTGGTTWVANQMNVWFVGFLAIDAVSAILLVWAVRDFQSAGRSKELPPG
jgi:membrane protein implicated in regulation of membrane protease activity